MIRFSSKRLFSTSGSGSSKFHIAKAYPYYLGNKPVFANKDLKVVDKYTLKPFTVVALANAKVIDQAAQMSHDAATAVRKMRPFERKQVLQAVVDEVRARYDEFAHVLCVEAGKPLAMARAEVQRLIDTFMIASEETVRIRGEWETLEISPRSKGYDSVTRRFPIGPVSMIAPFNFPLNLAAHKIAPAIAAGCPWVMKPASRTPIGALMIADILSRQTIYPAGAFSVLPCSRDGADLFTTDERFKLLSFTGSPDVGWALKKMAGKKKVTLELGGNAAVIVDDVDEGIEQITDRIVMGAYMQSGQSCISIQRVFIRRELYDRVRDMLVSKTKALKQGDPKDVNTVVGPMIDVSEAVRLKTWIDEAVAGGGHLLCGGHHDGAFVSATIVERAPRTSKLVAEEAFGPAMVIEPYDTFEHAIQLANDSKFGLQIGVYTSNLHKAEYAFEEAEVGGVVINDMPSLRVDSQAYGGVKESGLGREGLRAAIEDMSEPRVMIRRRTAANENTAKS